MFQEGDIVNLVGIKAEVKDVLSEALEVDFEKIEFYFVEYEDDVFATLSAETDNKFAIIHCPIIALDTSNIVKEIDHLCHQLLIDGALARGDKEAFMELTNKKDDQEVLIGKVFEEE